MRRSADGTIYNPTVSTTGPKTIPDPYPAADYDPALYAGHGEAASVRGFAAVGPRQIEQYGQDGYLLVRGGFTAKQVAEACAGVEDMMARRTEGTYELMYERVSQQTADEMPGPQRRDLVRKVFHLGGIDPRIDALMCAPDVRRAVERLGFANPRVLQSMALVKAPGGREKPWHQDKAYFNLRPQDRAVGVWIALDRAEVANGCMRLMPGMHREPRIHFNRRDWQICDSDILQLGARCVTATMDSGDVLFFDSMLPHGTPRNDTRTRRRALQFHYVAGDTPDVDERERLAAFGSDGKDVTC